MTVNGRGEVRVIGWRNERSDTTRAPPLFASRSGIAGKSSPPVESTNELTSSVAFAGVRPSSSIGPMTLTVPIDRPSAATENLPSRRAAPVAA